ncbi:MAG: TetR-like C-terminal domain-containing protein [Streptosporangiaceae bacterium]
MGVSRLGAFRRGPDRPPRPRGQPRGPDRAHPRQARQQHAPRPLLAEADAFPDLHRGYFDQIVRPPREAVYHLIRRSIASGEVRPDIDIGLVNDVLVGPILARMGSGAIEGLDPVETSRRIVELVFHGIQAS